MLIAGCSTELHPADLSKSTDDGRSVDKIRGKGVDKSLGIVRKDVSVVDDKWDRSVGSEEKGLNERLDTMSDLLKAESSMAKYSSAVPNKCVVSEGINSDVPSRIEFLIVMEVILAFPMKTDSGEIVATLENDFSITPVLDSTVTNSDTE